MSSSQNLQTAKRKERNKKMFTESNAYCRTIKLNLLLLKNPKILDSWPCPSLPDPPSPQLKASPPSEEYINNNQDETNFIYNQLVISKRNYYSHNSQL